MAKEYMYILDPMTGKISETTILRVADQAFIPNDPANRDRQEFEEWLAQGNEPDLPPITEQPVMKRPPLSDDQHYSPEAELQEKTK